MYKEFAPRCAGFVQSIVHDRELALDITQDVFSKLWQRRLFMGNVENPETFLLECAKNCALNKLERAKTGIRYADYIRTHLSEITPPHSTETVVEEQLLYEKLLGIVAKMPSKRRKVFLLSRIHWLSNQQISAMMGLSVRTVETHISHALATIRKKLPRE